MQPSTTPKRQSWTEAERHEIQDYARQHPTEGWRAIKRWYEGQHPTKTLSQSQHYTYSNIRGTGNPHTI